MASTRDSTPASESGATSPTQLTPTSKVKAMLAAFDNDSDDELVGPSRADILPTLFKATPPTTCSFSTTNKTTAPSATKHVRSQPVSGSEDEEDDIVRPKGRMAAMMQANGASSEDDNASSADDARERVKKMLMSKEKSPAPTTEASNGSEDSGVPVISRKRKLRVGRQGTPKSSPPRRSASPGLFVSPAKPTTNYNAGDSGSDSIPDLGNARFMALVEKKKQERMARDAEAAKEKAKKAEEQKRYADTMVDEDDVEDSEGDRRLTQSSRPNRKASKKAIEEIHRETQRLSRNQQLAYNATTKKKFSKADFFAKFNKVIKVEQGSSRPGSSSSAAPHSDIEAKDTPPTSPASPAAGMEKTIVSADLPTLADPMNTEEEDVLPSLEDVLSRLPSSPPNKLDKGKSKAVGKALQYEATPKLDKGRKNSIETSEPAVPKKPMFTQRPIRVRPPVKADREASAMDSSDSDLEIVTKSARRQKLDFMFDRIPAKLARESHSLHALRMLAHIKSPGKQNLGRNAKRNQKPSMTLSELQGSLQQRARQQATREKEERLQALRDKGVVIQTAEEREQNLAEVEDIMARARQEGEDIAKREKAAAKKERKERGEADPLGDESSDDDDYKDANEVPEEELSMSGSEEEAASEGNSGEEEEADEMDLDGQEPSVANPMFDNEAAESDDEEAEAHLSIYEDMADDGDVDEDEEQIPTIHKVRRSRHANVISDDEDDEEDDVEKTSPVAPQMNSPQELYTKSPAAPNSVLRSATKTFIPGVTVAGPAGLGLTQIFAGTMDESQVSQASPTAPDESQDIESKQDSLAFLRRVEVPELPLFVPTMEEDTQDADAIPQSQISHIPESQPHESMTQEIQLNFSQSQMHGFDSLVEDTQMSQFPEPTQDVGFQHMTPIRGRFVNAPPSTVDTVLLDPTDMPETTEETPIVKKKGKLRQRAHVTYFSDEEDANEPAEVNVEDDEFDVTANAFDVMRKSSKKKVDVVDEFDKKKSKAKEMVNEQAEESEDEYAGLGGASDDESGGEADAFVKEMIDDEAGKDVDANKLAAFYADRERINDAKAVEKIYKDITNGGLRRKRGADYDLSDSDDGGEAKQRRKRQQFARRTKALLADERINKIAENPKKKAFLNALADRGSDDEMDFLDDFVEQENDSQSQSQSQAADPQVIPNSQPTSMGPPEWKPSQDIERAPANLRRTKPAKKPTNLSEIRESLSSLIEEPNAVLAPVDSGSESEGELEMEGADDLGQRKEKNKENRDPFALRRTNTAIVDRILLKRESSSTLSNNTKLAFATSSATQGFKVPPLLRRATTNNSIASSSNSSVSGALGAMAGTERTAGGNAEGGVKRGGGKNSGVNFFARENDRRAAVVKTEKRRERKMVKAAGGRRKVVGGLFAGGKFE